MLITEWTKYAEFAAVEKYIKAKDIDAIKKEAERILGSMYDLTIAQFYACTQGDFSHLGDTSKPTVLQVYWKKRFEAFVDEYAKQMHSLTLVQSAREIKASEGLVQTSFVEAMLVFAQKWFGLHSYREAENITMGDLLIAKRAAYNEARYQRQLMAANKK